MSVCLFPIIAASNITKGDRVRLVPGNGKEAQVRSLLSTPSFFSTSTATIPSSALNNFANGSAVAVDCSGNVYTTGSFAGTIQFGSYTLSSANTSIFIVKQDPFGKVLYARWATAPTVIQGSWIAGNALAVDKQGNVYVGGQFTGTFAFGDFIITSVGASEYVSAFVVKLDPDGNPLFAVNPVLASQYASAAVYGLAVNDKAVYITGAFGYTVNFGSFSLSTNTGNIDLFVASLDRENGNFTGAVAGEVGSVPVPGSASGNSIALDDQGNVYVTGFFQSSITLGSIVLPGVPFTINLLVTKLDSSLNFTNAITAVNTGSSSAEGYALAVTIIAGTPRIYVTGFFTGTVAFGSFNVNTIATDGNIFLLTLDSSLNISNVSVGVINDTASFAYGTALTADWSGNVFLAGVISGTVGLGPNSITSVPGYGGTMSVSLVSASGNFINTIATVIDDTSYAYGAGLASDNQGQLYVVGTLTGTVVFGSETINVPQFQGNVFVSQLSDDSVVKLTGIAPTSATAGNFITPLFHGKVRKVCSGHLIPSFAYVREGKCSIALPCSSGPSKYAGTAYSSKQLIIPY